MLKKTKITFAAVFIILIVGIILFPRIYAEFKTLKSSSSLIKMVEDCPMAAEIIGSPIEVLFKKNFVTAGVWNPPGPGFHGKLRVKGSKSYADIYYSTNIATMVVYTEEMIVITQKEQNGEKITYSEPKQIIVNLVKCKM